MTDYYEELGLDRSLSLAELNRELSKAESQWKKRRIQVPDKAVKMLALIVDARKAFATDASRAAYDRQLAELKRPKPKVVPKRSTVNAGFSQWEHQARAYYSNGQYVEAEIALEKAMRLASQSDMDAEFYLFASQLNSRLNNIYAALSYADKAILLDPDDASYELEKARIYMFKNWGGARKAAERAIAKAVMAGDQRSEGAASGLLAFIRFREGEREGVEELAKRAVELGDGDGKGQEVLDAFERGRVQERMEQSRQAAAEKALEAAKQKEAQWAAFKHCLDTHHVIGWVAFFICLATAFCPINSMVNATLVGVGISWLHATHSAWDASEYGIEGAAGPFFWTFGAAAAGCMHVISGGMVVGALILFPCYLALAGISRWVGRRFYEDKKRQFQADGWPN